MAAPAFEALLAVQELDTDIDRHRYRQQHLPERAELAAVDQRAAGLSGRLTAALGRMAVVADRESALEAELATTERRAAEVSKRLYGGTVSASRELQAMAAEVDSLATRAAGLEEEALQAMEEREPLDEEVAGLEREKASIEETRAGIQERIDAAEAELTSAVSTLNEQRKVLAAQVPADLMDTYERLRGKLDGVGAARLTGGSCTGCHLALPATEVDRLKHTPADTVVFCDQCGRILVR
jgi:predicted  nucleic acid-binding Zn-ribbon protein